jgi:hypothetical protein
MRARRRRRMRRSTLKLIAVVLLTTTTLVNAGCTADEEPDPTSREALQKAEPLKFGCSFVREEYSSFGTYSETKRTPDCSTLMSCSELDSPDSYRASLGDQSYYSSTIFKERVDFIGTCAEHEPISCEYLETGNECDACAARSCCAPNYLCDHDPNCIAITDCLKNCKEDRDCQNRCLHNGEYSAAKNLRAAVTCLASSCKEACGF